MTKADLARDIFFSSAKPGSGSSSRGNAHGAGVGAGGNAPKPTLSFFSAACAAFALGALVSRDDNPGAGPGPENGNGNGGDPAAPSPPENNNGGGNGSGASGGGGVDNNGGAGDGSDGGNGVGAGAGAGTGAGDASGTPAMLFALSEQALQLAEKTAAYDLDCVVAMVVQVLYMLHEGRMSVAQGVFPLVSGGFWGFGSSPFPLTFLFPRIHLSSLSPHPHPIRVPSPFCRGWWIVSGFNEYGGLTRMCAGGQDGERGADDGSRDGSGRVPGDV